MTTKKKTKKTSTVKAKSATKKKSRGASGKKIVAGKKPATAIAGKKIKGKTSAPITSVAKKATQKSRVIPVVTHGVDMHLIPVKGEIHPARTEEATQFEKVFKHNEETTLHLEQQKAKQILAGNRGGGEKNF